MTAEYVDYAARLIFGMLLYGAMQYKFNEIDYGAGDKDSAAIIYSSLWVLLLVQACMYCTISVAMCQKWNDTLWPCGVGGVKAAAASRTVVSHDTEPDPLEEPNPLEEESDVV